MMKLYAGCLGGAHQGHGDDILVPEGQEVEQDNGDDGGLCHGEDDVILHSSTTIVRSSISEQLT